MEYVTTDTELESVADAIREKRGSSAELEYPTEFVSEIQAITTGNPETIAEEYDSTKTYSVGEYVLYNDELYVCISNITTAEQWTAAHWEKKTVGEELTEIHEELDEIPTETYPDMTVGGIMGDGPTDQVPYNFRPSGGGVKVGSREVDKIVGGSLVWNQLVPDTGGSVSVPTQSGRKYLTRIGGTDSIVASTGEAISATAGTDNIHDLAAMFGSTIADYIYSLEQATAGAGVSWFRSLFPEDYYAYGAGTIQSVKTSAHIMRDADNNVIGNYPLDNTLELRGIPKLDSNNQLYFDGDTYESDGTVTRRYGIVDLGELSWSYYSGTTNFFYATLSNAKFSNFNHRRSMCAKYDLGDVYVGAVGNQYSLNIVGSSTNIRIMDSSYSDAATFKTAMSGVYLVYELDTSTTETADPFQNPQIVDDWGTEEYTDYAYEAGNRDVAIPVGHVTVYPANLRKKIEGLPWDLSMIAPIENGAKASKSYSAGEYFLKDDMFCKALTSIASGATFTLNTNYRITTVAAEIYAAINA